MESHWYRNSLTGLTRMLLPLSWLFRCLVSLRHLSYRAKISESCRFTTPIIVVGNITVGGTGKTPLVIWLAHFLRKKGFRPGIVSRGVGGKRKRKPRWVVEHTDPKQVGDEAILLMKCGQCPVVVGIDRVAAVEELLSKTDCNIVISDDGLQHYRLQRDIEIAVVDESRGLGNKCFLPAGPLRESPSRLSSVDFVIKQTSLYHNPQIKFEHAQAIPMTLQGDTLVSVKNSQQKVLVTDFPQTTVHAVAAIGNPQRFFALLRHHGFKIIEHEFSDHYLYRDRDFNFNDGLPIIMTEKDAVKCQQFADDRFWYIPVTAEIDPIFEYNLIEKLRRIRANSQSANNVNHID